MQRPIIQYSILWPTHPLFVKYQGVNDIEPYIVTPYSSTCLNTQSIQSESACINIGVDSGGQPGHAPPIIRMGGKPLFCPPNNQTRFFNFVYLKKINMKESRNRDNNTKKTEYILNERCKFCKKKLSTMRIFERIEDNFSRFFV